MAREPIDPRLERNIAAPTGASDISVYGVPPIALGLPAAGMMLGGVPATADAASLSAGPVTEATPAALPADIASGDGGSPFAAALIAPAMLAEAAISGMAALTVRPPAAPEAAPDDAAQSADRPGGSGTPPGLLTPDTIVPATAPMPAQDGASSAAMPMASAPDASGMAERIEARADAALDSVGERIDAMDDVVARIDQRVEAIDMGLDDRVAEIGATANAIGAGLADRVADAGMTADAIGESLATTFDALPAIDLGPVGGVDPAGGIDTLVSMVSAADIFGLPDIGGGEDALALPLGIGGGDLLAEFVPSDVLLNVPDPHDGAFGLLAGLTDDHQG